MYFKILSALVLSLAMLSSAPIKLENAEVVKTETGTHIVCQGDATIVWDTFDVCGGKLHFDVDEESTLVNRIQGKAKTRLSGRITSVGSVEFESDAGFVVEPNTHIKVGNLTMRSEQGCIRNFGKITSNTVLFEAQKLAQDGRIYAHWVDLKGEQVKNYGIVEAQTIEIKGDFRQRGHLIAPGGEIRIMGGKVSFGKSKVDVTNKMGAGRIHINGKTVKIDPEAVLLANSAESNGGTIKITSEIDTNVRGELFAEAHGRGKGGFVEISSKGKCSFDGKSSLASKDGADGTLLLDPKFVFIQPDGTDPATGNTFGNDSDASRLISGSALGTALDSANVIIQANTDITVADSVSSSSSNTLTLQAGRSVIITDTLTLNGPLVVVINDEGALAADREEGVAAFACLGANVSTQGADITSSVGTFGGEQAGTVDLISSVLDAGGGNIDLSGVGNEAYTRAAGMILAAGAEIKTSGAGTITINAVGAQSKSNNYGIYTAAGADAPNMITVENGDMVINGTGGDGDNFNVGCYLCCTGIVSTGSGTITLNAIAGDGFNQNIGLYMSDDTMITSTTGGINITAQGNGSQEFNYGMRVDLGATVRSLGAAPITVNATGGAGTNGNSGIIFTGKGSGISSTGGAVTLNGTAGGSGTLNQGVRLENRSVITATNAASVTITGVATPGGNYDNGVFVSGNGTTITSVDGNIDLTGTGAGVGPVNQGVVIEYSSAVQATGTGEVTITSTP